MRFILHAIGHEIYINCNSSFAELHHIILSAVSLTCSHQEASIPAHLKVKRSENTDTHEN